MPSFFPGCRNFLARARSLGDPGQGGCFAGIVMGEVSLELERSGLRFVWKVRYYVIQVRHNALSENSDFRQIIVGKYQARSHQDLVSGGKCGEGGTAP